MFRSSHTQAAPLSPPFHGAACFCIANPFPNRLPSIGATATTAAGGGNMESLLGQRPARRKCFLKHKADAGGRNPALSAKQTERLITAASVSKLRVGSPQLRRRLKFTLLRERQAQRRPSSPLSSAERLPCPPARAAWSGRGQRCWSRRTAGWCARSRPSPPERPPAGC